MQTAAVNSRRSQARCLSRLGAAVKICRSGSRETSRVPRKKELSRVLLRKVHRLGAATLDYVLLLGVIFPLVAFAIPSGKRIIQLTYELICTLIAWPLM